MRFGDRRRDRSLAQTVIPAMILALLLVGAITYLRWRSPARPTIPPGTPPEVASRIRGLYSQDPVQRAVAARNLRLEPSSSAAIPALIGLLSDDTEIRRLDPPDVDPGYTPTPGKEAARTLASIGKHAVEPLISELTKEDSAGRAMAACALGEMREHSAVEALIAAVRDRRLSVRAEASRALGLIGDRRAVGPLARAARDRDPGVRMNAVMALGWIKDERVIRPLMGALGDEDETVAATASSQLADLRVPGLEESLIVAARDGVPALRARVAGALRGRTSRPAVEALIALLQDENREVRRTAAWSLFSSESPLAVEALIRALRDPDSEVASWSENALLAISGYGEAAGRDPAAWEAWWRKNKSRLLRADS